jgi:ABC-type cobalt transport system substrate-binding protein
VWTRGIIIIIIIIIIVVVVVVVICHCEDEDPFRGRIDWIDPDERIQKRPWFKPTFQESLGGTGQAALVSRLYGVHPERERARGFGGTLRPPEPNNRN